MVLRRSNPPVRAAIAEDLHTRVYESVCQVPPALPTMVQIARWGPRTSRGVSWALRAVAASGGGPLAVPCHRVVNREGQLTGRMHSETPTVTEERLQAEAARFLPDGWVDLTSCLWHPDLGHRQPGK